MNGEFHIVPFLLHRKYDERFRILLEVPSQLHDLFFGISMDISGQLNFLLTKLEFHMRRSFLFTGSPVYYNYTPILKGRQGDG